MTEPTLGAFVLTYRRPADLAASLQALRAQTRPPDRILVVDNADDAETRALVADLGRPEVVYETTGENLGSAGGTAYGTRRLAEMGFDLIYSGDDDNPPRTDDTVERLLALLARSGSQVVGVGTVGARFDWRSGQLVRLADEELIGDLEVDFIGGDHKLTLKRAAVEAGGVPDPGLFFGYPDLEHCLRLRRAGGVLAIDGELMHRYRALNAKLGRPPRRAAVPSRPRAALWRHYYTSRNYVHMMRSTFGRADLARRETARALARSGAAFARGPAYGAAFTGHTLRGLADGWRGRLGVVVAPREKRRP